MSEPARRRDPWVWATLALWFVLFGVGLVPEPTFLFLRDVGSVVAQSALTNSPWLITIAFAGYLAVCAYQSCCLDGSLSSNEAQARGVEVGVIALVAFLPFPLELLVTVGEISGAELRAVVYLVGGAKFGAWVYLLVQVIRCYAFANLAVFSRVPSMFPSSHAIGQPSATTNPGAREPGTHEP
jgi:hypothetical protein